MWAAVSLGGALRDIPKKDGDCSSFKYKRYFKYAPKKKKPLFGKIVQFQTGSNKGAIELRVVQFWSEITLVNSKRTRVVRLFDFEITRLISDQIALHSV